jgi:hypothetical protein
MLLTTLYFGAGTPADKMLEMLSYSSCTVCVCCSLFWLCPQDSSQPARPCVLAGRLAWRLERVRVSGAVRWPATLPPLMLTPPLAATRPTNLGEQIATMGVEVWPMPVAIPTPRLSALVQPFYPLVSRRMTCNRPSCVNSVGDRDSRAPSFLRV